MKNISIKKLENGITVITENMTNINTFSMGFFVKTGAIHETEKESGISHFIEHLLFKGTSKRTAAELSEYVDFEGGIINAFTSREITAYYIKLMSNKIDVAIDVLTDMFLNSTFSEENIEKERNVIIEEIRMYEDIPEEVVHEKNLEYALDGIYSNSISGTIDSLNKITRDDILKYFYERYVSENLIICISGNFDREYLYKNLEDKMLAFRKKDVVRELDYSFKINTGENLIKKDTSQIHLCFTTRGVEKNSKMRYAASIVSNILGEGMSSRLFQKIREDRGLAYSVYSYLSSFKTCGLLTVYAGTTKNDYKEVIELIKKEFEDIYLNGISEQELRKAKNKYQSSIVFSLENSISRMNRLATSYLLYGEIKDIEKIKEEIESVTLEDIKKVSKFMFDEKYYSVTVLGDITV